MMNSGTMYNFGDIVLAEVPFVQQNDKNEQNSKARPALVLFTEGSNIVICAITSNRNRLKYGIPLTVEEGMKKESVILLDYIFTVSPTTIKKHITKLNPVKQLLVFVLLIKRILDYVPRDYKNIFPCKNSDKKN